jgi:hypothetical protein
MITPGKGTKEFKIGMTLSELSLNDSDIWEVEDRDVFEVYKTAAIWFFIVKNTEKLGQLSLFHPFSERVLDKVGIGDSLATVYETLGKCVINYKVHEPIQYPGISFEAESGSKAKAALVEVISVSDPFAFYGEIPKHIQDNLPGKKRKLP